VHADEFHVEISKGRFNQQTVIGVASLQQEATFNANANTKAEWMANPVYKFATQAEYSGTKFRLICAQSQARGSSMIMPAILLVGRN
jgi:hypothetical protein